MARKAKNQTKNSSKNSETTDNVTTKKKRGRKSTGSKTIVSLDDKKKEANKKDIVDDINIIAHIPILLDDESQKGTSVMSKATVNEKKKGKLFKDINSTNKLIEKINADNEKDSIITSLKQELKKLKKKLDLYENGKGKLSRFTEIHEIPKKFNITINGELVMYPLKTKKPCFYCKHHFDNVPFFIPLYEEHDGTIGVDEAPTCSPNCTLAYLNELNLYNSDSLKSLVYDLLECMGIIIKDIKPADKWTLIDTWGGHLSIDQYRRNFYVLSENYIQLLPQMTTVKRQVEKPFDKSSTIYKSNNSENLVLRRSKPLDTNRRSVDMMIIKK